MVGQADRSLFVTQTLPKHVKIALAVKTNRLLMFLPRNYQDHNSPWH